MKKETQDVKLISDKLIGGQTRKYVTYTLTPKIADQVAKYCKTNKIAKSYFIENLLKGFFSKTKAKGKNNV